MPRRALKHKRQQREYQRQRARMHLHERAFVRAFVSGRVAGERMGRWSMDRQEIVGALRAWNRARRALRYDALTPEQARTHVRLSFAGGGAPAADP